MNLINTILVIESFFDAQVRLIEAALERDAHKNYGDEAVYALYHQAMNRAYALRTNRLNAAYVKLAETYKVG